MLIHIHVKFLILWQNPVSVCNVNYFYKITHFCKLLANLKFVEQWRKIAKSSYCCPHSPPYWASLLYPLLSYPPPLLLFSPTFILFLSYHFLLNIYFLFLLNSSSVFLFSLYYFWLSLLFTFSFLYSCSYFLSLSFNSSISSFPPLLSSPLLLSSHFLPLF